MYDVITIGSAVIDVFVKSNTFMPHTVHGDVMVCENYGQKIEVDSFQMFTGGAGTNTAVGLARLGFHTAVLAEMGRDSLAQLVTRDLDQEEVDTSLLIREKKEQTGGSVILIGQDGGRTIMVHRGAASELSLSDLPQSRLTRAHWWHISSLGGHPDVLKKLFMLAKLHRVGVSWNPGHTELELLLHQSLAVEEIATDILFVNQEEWAVIHQWQSQLRRQIPQIVVTNGAQGGIILSGNHEQPFTSRKVKSVDDTGAGDAFASGFVAAHLRGRSATEAANWGVANACAVVQQVGAKPGLLSKAQIERIIASW